MRLILFLDQAKDAFKFEMLCIDDPTTDVSEHAGAKDLIFEVQGTANPFNAQRFYTKVLEWIELNSRIIVNIHVCFVFRLKNYICTYSQLKILKILRTLKRLKPIDDDISIAWQYAEAESGIKETGEILSDVTRISFDISLVLDQPGTEKVIAGVDVN